MKSSLHVAAAGLTDRGRQRARNEDAFLCDADLGLFAIADGLGGLPKGELASKLTIERLGEEVAGVPRASDPDWQQIFTRVNKAVVEAGRKITEDGIGSTLTVIRETGGRLIVGHLGDSGLFAFPPGSAPKQITTDHTMAQEMIDTHGRGVAHAIPEHYYHTLTQCIGQQTDLHVQMFALKPVPGTRYLLYTDGVTKTQELPELAELVAKAPSPEVLVRQIVELANARGGPDNVTAIALFC